MARKHFAGAAAAAEFERKTLRVPEDARVLIVGSRLYDGREDRRTLYKRAVGVDALPGPGVDVVCDLEDSSAVKAAKLGKFDHIECLSVLEHSPRPWLAAMTIETLLRRGGTLFVSVPFVWRVHAYPDDYWRFTTSAVRWMFPEVVWARLQYVSDGLRSDPYLRSTDVLGHPYLSRCEVMGYGERRP